MVYPILGQIETINVILSLFLTVAALAVTGTGLFFAHNYRHQMRMQLAEARRAAYSALWEITGMAKPTRLTPLGMQRPLTQRERRHLYEQMTDWYYRDGNGLLLATGSQAIYLKAKHNLVCEEAELQPPTLLGTLRSDVGCSPDNDNLRSCLSIRQLSLLRTELKADLAIYGSMTTDALRAHEREFLENCKVDLRSPQWRRAADEPPIREWCC